MRFALQSSLAIFLGLTLAMPTPSVAYVPLLSPSQVISWTHRFLVNASPFVRHQWKYRRQARISLGHTVESSGDVYLTFCDWYYILDSVCARQPVKEASYDMIMIWALHILSLSVRSEAPEDQTTTHHTVIHRSFDHPVSCTQITLLCSKNLHVHKVHPEIDGI
jgi:hypothetical protein